MSIFVKQKEQHRHRKQTCGYQQGKGKWEELGDWD